ncbi:MAG: DEAD/DEAH box helicase [bacterium]|nr:DEAD/DEAH box helicase [bacterium]
MNVSPDRPFQLIYSLFEHEYLGYLFESFVIQLDEKNRLTFSHQNISSKNAAEFASGLDDADYELIKMMDSMQQEVVVQHFQKKKIKVSEFFLKTYDKDKGNKLLQQEIDSYLDKRRNKILPLLIGKKLFEMGNDGEPAWKEIEIMDKPAKVLFHFMRNEDNTHYFPTLKYNDEKVIFQYNNSYIVADEPAWLVSEGKLYHFENGVDGKKLKPFLNKKFIVIPKNVEDTYYRKFVASVVASFDVYAKGFDIVTERIKPEAILNFSELASVVKEPMLFATNGSTNGNGKAEDQEDEKILFELAFKYGDQRYKADKLNPVSVTVEQNDDSYVFHRIVRETETEKNILRYLSENGLTLKNSRATLSKAEAFTWINYVKDSLPEQGIRLNQADSTQKKYFLGTTEIKLDIRENIDWFDIKAIVQFGEFKVEFKEIRKLILKKQREIKLPNGETAVIPDSWFTEYSELFAFAENDDDENNLKLQKHHLALVQELKNNNLANVTMSRKLEKLKEFTEIEDHPLPTKFKGELRPYQKAGFNWMQFLDQYNFGGCLADDMGLGKTVQTLAMLQAQKESENCGANLLIMPTSLIYNWEMEAKKFTPDLKILVYTGTNREKDVTRFANYDLVLTSYGIIRLDIDILEEYYFNYVILDESQAIKNPTSNIAKAVKQLKSRRKLILTGTPIENSTLDLWSQMSFVNPGLLGNQSFFKNEFLTPIEKNSDEKKTVKLNAIIKPFILRRDKSQVATELPEKVENIKYCTMSSMQEEFYEKEKSVYRNKIIDSIENEGLQGSQMLLLQGLTRLRQIANHPKMVDENYKGDSGKMEDITFMLTNAISKGHKILVFSQFVKHLNIISEYLKSQRIEFAYLDGSTKDRAGQVERFQNDDKIKLFLISLKAGGVGLNLTKADYVFILDPWWNPAIEAQAIDRAHRIGQENRVFTYKFITKNTVEEKILMLQSAKLKLATNLISVEESFVKSLTEDDIQAILS